MQLSIRSVRAHITSNAVFPETEVAGEVRVGLNLMGELYFFSARLSCKVNLNCKKRC